MSFQSGGNGGRPGMMSEINVTPLVDVMLVLLIIFMVAAPMMTQGMDVNLPQVDNKTIPTEDTQTILTIRVDGTVEYDKMTLRMEDMAFQVKGFMDAKGSKMVLIRADKETSYGNVAQVMSRLQQAGITSVGLVTEPIDRTRNSAPSGKPNRS